jgi:hypothetical protein
VKKFLTCFCLFSLLSCDDGDVIVTSFDFNNTALQFCGEAGGYLFFKTNESSKESLSLRLGNSQELFTQTQELSEVLNGNSNFVNYRIYNGEVSASYFCNEVPPTSPEVTSEFLGNSGTAKLSILTTLDDNDRLPTINSSDENLEGTGDKDMDGIPNFYDFDDDGDNVPTIDELDTANLDGDNDPLTNPLDTDQDGIPNYLDIDDDGDGVNTIDEDANQNLNPADDETVVGNGPDYLNNQVFQNSNISEYREHSYTFTTNVEVVLENLTLTRGDEEITRESLNMGMIENIRTGTFTGTPDFN